MKQWRYLVMDIEEITGAKLEDRLDEIGEGGWELVAVTAITNSGLLRYFFKQETSQ